MIYLTMGTLLLAETFGLLMLSGILIGLAVKKGFIALVLGISGYAIASYVGLPFLPEIKFVAINKVIMSLISSFQFHAIELTTGLLAFVVGLALGVIFIKKKI